MAFFRKQHPLEGAIIEATDEVLLGPDYGKNLEICAAIDAGQRGGESGCAAVIAVKAIRKRLSSKKPKIVVLALRLLDMCVKNCTSFSLHAAVATNQVMKRMVVISEGGRGDEAAGIALDLIQQWGIAFECMRDTLPLFHETYMRLVTSGAPFREHSDVDAPPVFTPPPSSADSSTKTPSLLSNAHSTPASHSPCSGGIVKLERDLALVRTRLSSTVSLISTLSRVGVTSEELLDDIDFAQQCQPRLENLIDAGMRGELGEGLFGQCLSVHEMVVDALRMFQEEQVKLAVHESSSIPQGKEEKLIDLTHDDSPEYDDGVLQEPSFLSSIDSAIAGQGDSDTVGGEVILSDAEFFDMIDESVVDDGDDSLL